MASDNEPGGEPAPEFAKGGLVLGPGGEDSVPVWIDLRCEHIYTAEQVRHMTSPDPDPQ